MPPPTQAAQRIALHEQERQGHVRPTGWTNPTPAPRYDLVVVGGGTAGIALGQKAAALGVKVALVEKHLLGGHGLNLGHVPSSALLAAARAAAAIRGSAAQGLESGPLKVDYESVVERLTRLRAGLSHPVGASKLAALGIDVFFGNAVFSSDSELKVDETVLRFKRACLATGARPAVPSVPGLADAGYLTTDTLWELTALPKKLVVLGGDATGCELAQAFARLGTQVFLIETGARLLPAEDAAAAAVVREALENEGVRIFTGARVERVIRVGVQVGVSFTGPVGSPATGDHVLVSMGRLPNVEGLGLDVAGVTFDRQGVQVDDQLRTTNRVIFAAGDCTPGPRAPHAAVAMAELVLQNSLLSGRKRASRLVLPTCVQTEPALAQVGLTEESAKAARVRIETVQLPFSEVDRAVLDGTPRGFVKLHFEVGTGELMGATIVGTGADELISLVAFAMANHLGAAALADLVPPYPTRADALRQVVGKVPGGGKVNGFERFLMRFLR